MKKIQKGLVVFMALLIAVSCSKKETTPPTGAETNGTLLAGPKGGTKSWKIISISESADGATTTYTPSSGTYGIPTCEADNIYQFSNNASQTYQTTEGATMCTPGDPSPLESGSWALTIDGKSLLIDARVYITDDQLSSTDEPYVYFMVLSHAQPLNVTQITDSSFTVTYVLYDTSKTPSTSHTFTLVFTKI